MFKNTKIIYYTILLITMLLYGCDELEKEGTATTSVKMKMEYSQPSSRMGLSNANLTEGVKTELIVLVPATSTFNASYKNLTSAFEFALTDLTNSTVKLKFPLDTQVKLFAYRFSNSYSLSNLVNADIHADSVGQSSSFQINSGMNSATVKLVISANGNPGYEISAITGTPSESGGQATFSVSLATPPKQDVTVALSSDNPAEGVVTPNNLNFTPATWNVGQKVTVEGVDDTLLDGDQTFRILYDATSTDLDYIGLVYTSDDFINVDDEVPVTTSPGMTIGGTGCGNNGNAHDLMCVYATPSVLANPTNSPVLVQIGLGGEREDIHHVEVSISGPESSTGQERSVKIPYLTFNATTGFWEGKFYFSTYHEMGSWRVGSIYLSDNYGGWRGYRLKDNDQNSTINYVYSDNNGNIIDSGVRAGNDIVVTGTTPDRVTPVITSIQVSASSLSPPSNLSTTIKLGVTEIDSGIEFIRGTFYYPTDPPDRNHQENIHFYFLYNSSSGLWESTVNFSQYSQPGEWKLVDFNLSDKAGNPQSYYSYNDWDNETYATYKENSSYSLTSLPAVSITLSGSDPSLMQNDTTAPIITSVALTPSSITVNGPTVVTAKVGIQDTQSGVEFVWTRLLHSERNQNGDLGHMVESNLMFNPSSALWEGDFIIEEDFSSGTWKMELYFGDYAGNQAYLFSLDNQTTYQTTKDYVNFYDTSIAQVVVDISGTTPIISTNNHITSESGISANIEIVLDSPPTSNVDLSFSSTNTAEGTININSMTFTPSTWNVPQILTVTGVDDTVQDGDQNYLIQFSATVSLDSAYSGIIPEDISLTNVDDDQPIRVTGTIPRNNNHEVPTGQQISISFSGQTVLSTYPTTSCSNSSSHVYLSADNFTTCLQLGTPATSDNHKFTITPLAPGLENGKTYQLKIMGGSNGVPKLANDYYSTFTTYYIPEIRSAEPSDNSTSVSRYSSILVRFNKSMDPASFQGIQISPLVAGIFQPNKWNYEITFYPYKPLDSNTLYTINYPSTILDQTGGNLVSTTLSFQTVDTNSGLIAHFPFDGNANDATGLLGNGTISGATLSKGRLEQDSKAYFFDGSSTYIDIPSSPNIGSVSHTLSVWVKIPTVGSQGLLQGEEVGIIMGNNPNSPETTWEVNNLGQIHILWNVNEVDSMGYSDLRDDKWHMLTFVRDINQSQISLYVDGQLESTSGTAGSNITFTSAFRIGADFRTSTPKHFHGSLDDLKIFNRALNEPEIRDLYIEHQRGLSVYFPFNGNYNDTSANGFSITPYGAPILSSDRGDFANKAVLLDGSSYLTVAHNSLLDFVSPNDFSFSVWIKPQRLESGNGILSKSELSGNGGYRLQINDLSGNIFFGNDVSNLITNYYMEIDSWNHIVGSFKNGTGIVFVNGFTMYNGTISWTSNSNDLYIGCSDCTTTPNPQNLFKGEIDDFRLYNRPLSEEEIKGLFSILDTQPPVPGNQGLLQLDNSTQLLSWNDAVDDHSLSTELEYKVIHSTLDTISSVAEVEMSAVNHTILQNWIFNISSFDTSSVPSGTNYFNVLVKDKAGNVSIYQTK